jgi:hypothetical protein
VTGGSRTEELGHHVGDDEAVVDARLRSLLDLDGPARAEPVDDVLRVVAAVQGFNDKLSATNRRPANTARCRRSVVSFRNTVTSSVQSQSHASSASAESNDWPPTSVSSTSARLENGSCTPTRSPRSTIERKNAVDLDRGALHNANTGTPASYPEPTHADTDETRTW